MKVMTLEELRAALAAVQDALWKAEDVGDSFAVYKAQAAYGAADIAVQVAEGLEAVIKEGK